MWQRHKQPTNINNANQSNPMQSIVLWIQTDTNRPLVWSFDWRHLSTAIHSYRVPVYPYAEYQWNWTAFNCEHQLRGNHVDSQTETSKGNSLFIFCFRAKPLKCVLHKSTLFTRIQCFFHIFPCFSFLQYLKSAHSFCLHSQKLSISIVTIALW